MPVNETLTPQESSYIATNAYFALKDWVLNKPVAGLEAKATIVNRVLGPGDIGLSDPKLTNPTLKATSLAESNFGTSLVANTGFGVNSGFGYTLSFNDNGRRHSVVAFRGTRPELSGYVDLLTDARGSLTAFGDYGLVHKGFKTTFDSALPSLAAADRVVMSADIVHCVGHSLGGAVATLAAAHYAARGKSVKLYTFGSPRVGAFNSYWPIQNKINVVNIYRVAHDLDIISMLGPFPYVHVNPGAADWNNFTLRSPMGVLFSTMNHDMNRYIASVTRGQGSWDELRLQAAQADHDNTVLARLLLHKDNDPGWVQYASAKTLGILFKLFNHVLKTISTSVILGLTATDLLAEVLVRGLYKLKALGDQVLQLLRYSAKWAGITVIDGAEFTARIINLILSKMLAAMRATAVAAINNPTRYLMPLPLAIAASAITSCTAF